MAFDGTSRTVLRAELRRAERRVAKLQTELERVRSTTAA
jgi:hypothetical protein